MAPQVGYMHLGGPQACYSSLKADSFESEVDSMWNAVLRQYFPADTYFVTPQGRPWPGVTKTKSDLVVRRVTNGPAGLWKSVILIENKRVAYESSDAIWENAVTQLTNYMKTTRGAEYKKRKSIGTLFAIVTVGRYSRFYELLAGENTLRDYPIGNGKAYEFKRDEEMIDTVLLEFVQKTSN
ncbi:hypothetical protein F4810DRAFT_326095 [Camillea tinctor]|nr:hypothetical protein F4810DRAFT_326095 [Camillea tinctor]